ncbi:MAG TPA: ribosomal-protein-alanine N-acetyltransferase [Spongiibacteraceae bacterium]|nr:ribosomal-protein-alanine N-acetyltransferase [Spongiibacteraceae bacterium]HCS28543.1 ribosomal-protein-alanine N-acetyltransferase [Spongiibacteraceae bacterium]
MTTRIEILRPSEIDSVMELEATAGSYRWTRADWQGSFDNDQCFKLRVGGAIKAVAAFSVVFDEANLLNVAVHKTAQRKGLARKLLSECLAAYAGQGIKNCFLEVRRSNRPAINLYEQLGFTCIGERKNYYPVKGGREDALVLICQLQRKDTQRESQHA